MGRFLRRNSLSIIALVLLVAVNCINCKPAISSAGKESSKASSKFTFADDVPHSVEELSEQAEEKSRRTDELSSEQEKKSSNSKKKLSKLSDSSEKSENDSSEKKKSKGSSEVSDNIEKKSGKSGKRSDSSEDYSSKKLDDASDKRPSKKVVFGEESTLATGEDKVQKKSKSSQRNKDVSTEDGYSDDAAAAHGGWDIATIMSEHDDDYDGATGSAAKNEVSSKKSKKQSADEDSEPLPRPAGQKRWPETTITPREHKPTQPPSTNNGGFSSSASRVVYAILFTVCTAALLI